MRRKEFLQQTANQLDYEIVGEEKRANLMREVARSLDLDVNDIVPTKEEMSERREQKEQQMAAMMQQQQQAAPQQQPPRRRRHRPPARSDLPAAMARR